MLVFSALVPYPPVFTAAADNKHKGKLKKTLSAYESLAAELYASKPDALILISRYHNEVGEFFSASMAERYTTSLKELGDFETSKQLDGDVALMQEIKEKCMQDTPLAMNSDSTLEYTMAIPIHLLTQQFPGVKIVPIYYSSQSNADHLRLGGHLREVIESTSKRIAVVACGNLSHCVTESGPAPFKPEGKQFDQVILKALKAGKAQKLAEVDEALSSAAQECGFKPLLVLTGILKDQHYTTEVLAYEYPFGVGYLTANFRLY